MAVAEEIMTKMVPMADAEAVQVMVMAAPSQVEPAHKAAPADQIMVMQAVAVPQLMSLILQQVAEVALAQ
jgi:hypothetical protein